LCDSAPPLAGVPTTPPRPMAGIVTKTLVRPVQDGPAEALLTFQLVQVFPRCSCGGHGSVTPASPMVTQQPGQPGPLQSRTLSRTQVAQVAPGPAQPHSTVQALCLSRGQALPQPLVHTPPSSKYSVDCRDRAVSWQTSQPDKLQGQLQGRCLSRQQIPQQPPQLQEVRPLQHRLDSRNQPSCEASATQESLAEAGQGQGSPPPKLAACSLGFDVVDASSERSGTSSSVPCVQLVLRGRAEKQPASGSATAPSTAPIAASEFTSGSARPASSPSSTRRAANKKESPVSSPLSQKKNLGRGRLSSPRVLGEVSMHVSVLSSEGTGGSEAETPSTTAESAEASAQRATLEAGAADPEVTLESACKDPSFAEAMRRQGIEPCDLLASSGLSAERRLKLLTEVQREKAMLEREVERDWKHRSPAKTWEQQLRRQEEELAARLRADSERQSRLQGRCGALAKQLAAHRQVRAEEAEDRRKRVQTQHDALEAVRRARSHERLLMQKVASARAAEIRDARAAKHKSFLEEQTARCDQVLQRREESRARQSEMLQERFKAVQCAVQSARLSVARRIEQQQQNVEAKAKRSEDHLEAKADAHRLALERFHQEDRDRRHETLRVARAAEYARTVKAREMDEEAAIFAKCVQMQKCLAGAARLRADWGGSPAREQQQQQQQQLSPRGSLAFPRRGNQT